MQSHQELYKRLVNYIIEKQGTDRIIIISDIEEIASRVGTVEIAPNKTFYEWILDKEEIGILEKIRGDMYKILDDVFIT